MITRPNHVPPETSMTHAWCSFYNEAHDPKICESFMITKEREKGKNVYFTIVVIEDVEQTYDVFVAITRSQAVQKK
jgi:hypothetical protein